MGVLDKIRQMAETAKSAEEAQAQQETALRARYEQKVLPAMEKIFSFCVEIEQHLNYIKPDIRASYDIPGFGLLNNVQQGNYQISKGRKQFLEKIPFHFSCTSPQTITRGIQDNRELSAALERLDRAGLKYECKKSLGRDNQPRGGVIDLIGYVPISIVFKGQMDSADIHCTIKNYFVIDQIRSVFQPEAINDAFFEEFGNFILREKNNFLTVELSEQQRAHFSDLVKQEKEQERLRELEARLERERELELERQKQAERKSPFADMLRKFDRD
jgi:hypothetical protein